MKDITEKSVQFDELLSCSLLRGEQLANLINLLPNAAHIKDTDNGQYIAVNKGVLDFFGLTHEDQLVGRTLRDIDETIMRPYWGRQFAQEIIRMEQQVIQQQKIIVMSKRAIIGLHGLITVCDLTKAPIFNSHKQVIAMISMGNIFNNFTLFELFALYRKLYCKRTDSIRYFLKHLKVECYFNTLLTEREVCCLLYMVKRGGYKYVAHQLNISLKTVETHIGNIKDKMIEMDLNSLLSMLRDFKFS